MSYINDTLMKNEIVLYRTKPHWIVFLQPIFWFVLSILLFLFGPYIGIINFRIGTALPTYTILALITLVLAVVSAIGSLVNYQTSEYGITNKRVLMKLGFIRRMSLEIYLQKIESVKVYQSVLGRLLNYGSIIISGVGGSKDPFHTIPKPLDFRRRVQEEIEISEDKDEEPSKRKGK